MPTWAHLKTIRARLLSALQNRSWLGLHVIMRTLHAWHAAVIVIHLGSSRCLHLDGHGNWLGMLKRQGQRKRVARLQWVFSPVSITW